MTERKPGKDTPVPGCHSICKTVYQNLYCRHKSFYCLVHPESSEGFHQSADNERFRVRGDSGSDRILPDLLQV